MAGDGRGQTRMAGNGRGWPGNGRGWPGNGRGWPEMAVIAGNGRDGRDGRKWP